MLEKQILLPLTSTLLALLITGCTSPETPRPSYQTAIPTQTQPTPETPPLQEKEIDLSQKSPHFHTGMNDGCATARGKYTKNSTLYKSDKTYSEGWFYGRRKCQPHKAI